jgi:hypothetical protein
LKNDLPTEKIQTHNPIKKEAGQINKEMPQRRLENSLSNRKTDEVYVISNPPYLGKL